MPRQRAGINRAPCFDLCRRQTNQSETTSGRTLAVSGELSLVPKRTLPRALAALIKLVDAHRGPGVKSNYQILAVGFRFGTGQGVLDPNTAACRGQAHHASGRFSIHRCWNDYVPSKQADISESRICSSNPEQQCRWKRLDVKDAFPVIVHFHSGLQFRRTHVLEPL